MPDKNRDTMSGGTAVQQEVRQSIQQLKTPTDYINAFRSFVEHGRSLGLDRQQLTEVIDQNWSDTKSGGQTGGTRSDK